MGKIDYDGLGFKCGLEVHQQIEGRKLFCHCPTLVNDPNKADIVFKRKLNLARGETGGIDEAALHEVKKGKEFTYEACSTSSCLVEYDESPPEEVNKGALETALQVALLLKCKLADEVVFMRKTVIDGSNVSGFQRTALIGFDGCIETSKGKVGIQGVCLEEESAKKIKEDEKTVTYRLDRIGVPLIEIATDSNIKDNEHAKEVASYIGMVLRSCDKVKRGLGTIRQDLNVSVKGHPRVEVKGFQDLRSIPKVIEHEVSRMLKDIKENKKLEPQVRKVESDFTTSYLRPMPGASRMYPETDIETFRITEHILNEIKIPELATERALKLEKEYGLNSQFAKEVLTYDVFFILVDKYKKIDPNFIAQMIVEMPKEIQSRYNLTLDKLKDEDFEIILQKLDKNEISKDAILEILVEICKGNMVDFDRYKAVDFSKVERDIIEIIKKNKGASFNAIMGDVMKVYRGKVDSKKIVEIIKNNM